MKIWLVVLIVVFAVSVVGMAVCLVQLLLGVRQRRRSSRILTRVCGPDRDVARRHTQGDRRSVHYGAV